MGITLIIAVYQWAKAGRNAVLTPVWGDVSLLPWAMALPSSTLLAAVANDLTGTVCSVGPPPAPQNLVDLQYNDGKIRYSNITCAVFCSDSLTIGQSCINPSELVQIDRASVFIPTVYRDSGMLKPSTASAVDLSATLGTSSYVVPAVSSQIIAFSHQFQTYSAVPQPNQLPSTGYFHSSDTTSAKKSQIKTVVLNFDGSVMTTFEPGVPIQLSVAQIMQAAKIAEFNDQLSRLVLDSPYTRPEEEILGTARVRLTGATITINLWYTNQGACRLTPDFPWNYVKFEGYLCCVSIRFERNWVSKLRESVFGVDGSYMTRTYHGLKVQFDSGGQVGHTVPSRYFEGLTQLLIWLQIPAFLVYFFMIYGMGGLSKIYRAVVHQRFSMGEAFIGLASRMCFSSSSWMDLKEAGTGVTERRLRARLQDIFKDDPSLDPSELEKLSQYVFRALADTPATDKHDASVSITSYSRASQSNEQINLETLQAVFQSGITSPLELLCPDPTLRVLARTKPEVVQQLLNEELSVEGVLYSTGELRGTPANLEKMAAANLSLSQLKVANSILNLLVQSMRDSKQSAQELFRALAGVKSAVHFADFSHWFSQLHPELTDVHRQAVWFFLTANQDLATEESFCKGMDRIFEVEKKLSEEVADEAYARFAGIVRRSQDSLTVWRALDADNDGSVTQEEFTIYFKAMDSTLSDRQMQMLWRQFDIDGDCVISEAEFLAAVDLIMQGQETISESGASLLRNVEANFVTQIHQHDILAQKLKSALDRARSLYDKDEETRTALRKREVDAGGPPEERPPTKLVNGATYTGQWVGSVRHGYGAEHWPDGSFYEGEWQFGRVHGECIYRLSNGAKYEGEWQHGKQHGHGFEVTAEGARYEGQYKDGQKSGRGAFYLVDGSTYVGEVLDSAMHGHGRYEWSNGHCYEGQWDKDLMHGDGTYVWADGVQYQGQYVNNLKQGQGTFSWPDGRVYEGEYFENERHGHGVFTYADGTKREGDWVKGKQHGEGVVTTPDGNVYKAMWDMGVQINAQLGV